MMHRQTNNARILLTIFVFQSIFAPITQMQAAAANQQFMVFNFNGHKLISLDNTAIKTDAPAVANLAKSSEICKKSAKKTPKNAKRNVVAPQGGPGTPEVQTFTAAGTDNMVDLFSGDFTYNIPLLDVGGYPINLSYHSGIGPNDEASWVGLGWTLNPGAVNPDVRGLPDALKGDIQHRDMNLKPNETTTISGSFGIQFFGVDIPIGLNANTAVSYNNYNGWGLTSGLGVSLQASGNSGNAKLNGSLSLTAGIDSRAGGYLDANAGLDAEMSKAGANLGIGVRINALEGLESVSFEMGAKYSTLKSQTSGAFPFASPSFMPKIDMPMRNQNMLFRGTLGGELNGGIHMNGSISGSRSVQELASKHHGVNSFGYLYAQNAGSNDQLDLNREKDGPYQKEVPNLPVTAFTYDLYSVTAQGINEQFRPFRGDIGTLHDAQMSSTGTGISAGIEVGLGNLTHIGLDLTAQNTQSLTQKWIEDNAMAPMFPFVDSVAGTPLFEPVYFKSLSESTALGDEEQYRTLRGGATVKTNLEDPNLVSFGRATNMLSNGVRITNPAQTLQRKRTPRNSQFSWLTAEDMAQRGAEWATMGIFQKKGTLIQERKFGHRMPHHISEIEVTADGGTRFQYGIPAYNTLLKQVSFNVGSIATSDSRGLVAYTAGTDNSIRNSKGENWYFNAEKTPAHAYAWLLTSVLSSDYKDLTNNGPSADDFGSYTKFSYELAHSAFKWRNPVVENHANLDERASSDPDDDQGHYTYGEKEIWYLSQINTRNYVAVFETSDRDDAKGVRNENGGIDERQRLKKLDKISLYTVQEYEAASTTIPARTAIPLKTVHFEYDYSLCTNALGSAAGQGKLSLKKLWFTYQQSTKDAFSPYQFNYAENPAFAYQSNDRWGQYKPNVLGPTDNARMPYVNQNNRAAQDRHAAAWNLSDIALPTGGLLHIEYESDDYAYVQDKKAMQVCEVTGFSQDATSAISQVMVNAGNANANYLHFRLPEGVALGNIEQLYNCFSNISNLYFNINVQIKAADAQPEAVAGFVPLTGIIPTGGGQFGFDPAGSGTAWIRLPEQTTDNRHAVVKAGFEMIRKSMPRRMDNEKYDREDFLAALDNFARKLENVFAGGIEKTLFNGHFCREMRPGSFIRLYQPSGYKLGGGCRVKKITISDQWGNMQRSGYDDGLDFEYGQEYRYETTDPISGRTISAGVASYEPMIGNDENPMVQPVSYVVGMPLSVNLNFYQLEPFGESFFPAAQVGYSRVEVRNLNHDDSIRSASGHSVSEFYTAKDFPVMTQQTPLEALFRDVWVPILNLYNLRVNAAVVSQGFLVNINDMHGKPKSNRIFDQAGTAISGADYTYLSNGGRLSGTVPTLDGSSDLVTNRNLGGFWDLAVDARQFKNISYDGGAGLNLEISMYGPAPIPIPVVLPNISEGKSEYRGITMTKVVRQNGILTGVTAFDNGASIATRNLVWDANTGQVLVTETENEFGNHNYQVNLPAYWAYPAMGQAAKNAGLHLRNMRVLSSGNLPLHNAASLFVGGEELWLYPQTDAPVAGVPRLISPALVIKAWVYRVEPARLILIDALGQNIAEGRYDLKVIRSGYRNMPGAGLGGFVTQTNPIVSDRLTLNPERVLNASAQTYSDFWQTDILFSRTEPDRSCECEPASYNPKLPLGAMATLVRRLITDPTARDVAVMTAAGQLTYRITANAGNFISGEVQFNDELPCEFTVTSTYRGGTGILPDLNTCTPDWNALQFDPLESGCGSPDGFFVPCSQDSKQGIRVYAPCLNFLNCHEQTSTASSPRTCGGGGVLNPYSNNVLGNWRSLTNYRYITGRTNTGHTANSGFYTEPLQFFWAWNSSGTGLRQSTSMDRWQRADSIAVFNTFGQILETFDALNRPASTFYGNGHTLDLATAANAHYTDIGYEGFEEYYYYARRYYNQPGYCQYKGHLMLDFDMDFADTEAQLALSSFIVKDRAHSGKHSLKCSPARTFYVRRKIWQDSESFVRGQRSERVTGSQFMSRPSDQILPFTPKPGRYYVSAWVQETDLENKSNFINAQLNVRITGQPLLTFRASGPIIEGWQQIYAEFEVTSAATDIELALSSLGGEVFFDDLRIQPLRATMQTFVYDDIALRLIATHDAQNFTSFYEYDSEGQLARQKRETERGVLTLKEIRAAKVKSE